MGKEKPQPPEESEYTLADALRASLAQHPNASTLAPIVERAGEPVPAPEKSVEDEALAYAEDILKRSGDDATTHPEIAALTFIPLIRRLRTARAEGLQQGKRESETHLEELQERVGHACACSYDQPGPCFWHAEMLKKAEARGKREGAGRGGEGGRQVHRGGWRR